MNQAFVWGPGWDEQDGADADEMLVSGVGDC